MDVRLCSKNVAVASSIALATDESYLTVNGTVKLETVPAEPVAVMVTV
jgi:hypothetical protein